MKTNLLSISLSFAVVIMVIFNVSAQQLLPCDADSLQLTRLELEQDALVRLHFRTSGLSDEVIFQEVMHTYDVSGEPFVEIKPVEDNVVDFFLQSLAGSHEFRVINTCINESAQHFGAAIFVNFTFEEDLNCPPITDLVIDQFTNDFIAFSWADTSIHIEYQVGYQPGVAPEQITSGLLNPSFEQILANAVVHNFTIIAFCDDPSPNRAIVQSPAVRFSVVTIDDIKLLPDQVDSAEQAIPIAFRMNATCHPFQNTVNTDDFLNNLNGYILNQDSCMMVSNTLESEGYLKQLQVFPNPAKNEVWLNYELPVSQNVWIDLLDWNGQILGKSCYEKNQPGGWNETKLELNILPPGMYLLQIRGERFRQYSKVMVSP